MLMPGKVIAVDCSRACGSARLALIFSVAGILLSCDGSSGNSSSRGRSSISSPDSVEELRAAVDELEAVQKELAVTSFDNNNRLRYIAALDAELEQRNYDFNGVLFSETKSRTQFRDRLLNACQVRGVSPPEYLYEFSGPFSYTKADIDWDSSDKQLPEEVRSWIAEQAVANHRSREKLKRVSGTGRVAQKILEVSELHKTLQGKLSKTRDLLHTLSSDMSEIQQEIVTERTENRAATAEAAMSIPNIRNNLELLRSKRAYVQYLTATATRLEAGTKDLLFIERQSRDEFRVKRLIGGDESHGLLSKIDAVLTKYHHEALDRKLDVTASETLLDVWREIQPMESKQ
jgi:hypothetical protein